MAAALGEVGLGTVVRAHDTRLRIPVAIKRIRRAPAIARSRLYDQHYERVEGEAIAGARVRDSA